MCVIVRFWRMCTILYVLNLLRAGGAEFVKDLSSSRAGVRRTPPQCGENIRFFGFAETPARRPARLFFTSSDAVARAFYIPASNDGKTHRTPADYGVMAIDQMSQISTKIQESHQIVHVPVSVKGRTPDFLAMASDWPGDCSNGFGNGGDVTNELGVGGGRTDKEPLRGFFRGEANGRSLRDVACRRPRRNGLRFPWRQNGPATDHRCRSSGARPGIL